ncbi:MAG: patatin-like phospholipase family protein [Kosmotoga sp.]|nr:MAG: patatin-like phospholipase family protein [Kosmotoga sp.]
MNNFIIILVIFMLISGFSYATENEGCALVLSGGGGRGAYEIGVWKALKDLGIKIDAVYGTSVGAINGLAVATNKYEKARDIWIKTDYDNIMKISPDLRNLISGSYENISISSLSKGLSELFQGIDVQPLKNALMNVIEEKEVRESEIDYGLVAYSISSMEPRMMYIEEIPDGKLIDYVLASANFPVFKRENILGETFMDGGVYSNIPIEMAINRGHKRIVAVDIGTYGISDLLSFLNRNAESKAEIKYIKPLEHYGNLLTFDIEVSKKYIKEGYLDGLKSFGLLKGNKYYIFNTEDVLKELFYSMNKNDQKQALILLGVENIDIIELPVEYVYYRLVLPRLENIAGTGLEHPEETCTAILELMLEFYNIERLYPYSPGFALEKVNEFSNESPSKNQVEAFFDNIQYGDLVDFVLFLLDKNELFTKDKFERYDELLKNFKELTN